MAAFAGVLLFGACNDGTGSKDTEAVEEERPLPTVEVGWNADPRYGLDTNDNGIVDLPNTRDYVQAAARAADCDRRGCSDDPNFSIRLKADNLPSGLPNEVVFRWSISSPGSRGSFTHRGDDPEWNVRLPEGSHDVQLEVQTPTGGILAKGKAVVTVNDILIAALGDSFLSGDGAPELHAISPNFVSVGIKGTDALGAGGSRLDLVWADSGSDEPTRVTHFRFASVVPSGPTSYTEFNGGDAVSRSHSLARRSSRSPVALAAHALEQSDARTSVTLVNLAAARTRLVAESGRNTASPKPLLAQVEQLGDLLGCWDDAVGSYRAGACDRSVDLAVVSIGYEDVGVPQAFAAMLVLESEVLTAVSPIPLDEDTIEDALVGGDWTAFREAFSALASVTGSRPLGVESLPMDALRARLEAFGRHLTDAVAVDSILLLSVVDPLRTSTGTCSEALTTVTPLGSISSAEAVWLRSHVFTRVNANLRSAAASLDWNWAGELEGGFEDGHGVCGPAAFAFSNDPGFAYPPAPLRPDAPEARWFLTPREAAIMVGGPRSTLPPALHLNEAGRREVAAIIEAAVPG